MNVERKANMSQQYPVLWCTLCRSYVLVAVCTFYHRFTRMACSKQIGKVWSIWIQLNMICTMQTLACALHHYFRINRVEVSLIQSICGQFKDRQNKSLKIGKQSCKVELYFRFRLTLIENHFSCIYAIVWLCFARFQFCRFREGFATVHGATSASSSTNQLTLSTSNWHNMLSFSCFPQCMQVRKRTTRSCTDTIAFIEVWGAQADK